MIYIKASPIYFASQFQRLILRLEKQEPETDPYVLLAHKRELGRLCFLAGETLPEEDFINLMSALIKRFNFNPKYYRTLFIQAYPKTH